MESSPTTKRKSQVINSYLIVFKALKNRKQIWLPFLVFVLVELVGLFLIYITPRQPFVKALGPIVKAFWGERFLHYPLNFVLLPQLASLSRNFLSVFLGPLTTGLAVFMIAEAYHARTVKLGKSLRAAFSKYLSVFFVILCVTALFFGALKLSSWGLAKYFISGHRALLGLGPRAWLGPLLIAINFIFIIFIQGIFIYCIPLIMLENMKLLQAIGRSVAIFFKMFFSTVMLIIIPLLFFVPIVVLQYNTAAIINKFVPEYVLYIAIAAVLVNSLIVDLFITTTTTVLYLENKDRL